MAKDCQNIYRVAMLKPKSRSRRTETPQDVEKTASEGKW